MRHRTRLNDIKKRKKRAGLSLLAKKRIIGISTMILAGLLMAVPFFTRAVDLSQLEPLKNAQGRNVAGTCGIESAPSSTNWEILYPTGDENSLILKIEGQGEMRDFILNASGKVADPVTNTTRPWEDYMDRIKVVLIGPGITRIGNYAFAVDTPSDGTLKTSIEDIQLETDPNKRMTIGTGAFWGAQVKNLVIPRYTDMIEPYAFYRCESLETVQFMTTGDTANRCEVREIGANAFADCTKLKEVFSYADTAGQDVRSLPEGADLICSGAFYNTALTSITIPSSVIEIGEIPDPATDTTAIRGAFENCKNLKTVNFYTGSADNSTLRTIGVKTFKGTALEGRLNLPQKTEDPTISQGSESWLTKIGDEAFYGLSKLIGELNIPNTVTEIGARAFWGCSGFTGTLTLPDKLTEIKESTFSDCSGMTGTLTIPRGVASVGAEAFLGCDGVSNVTFTGVPQSIGALAFKQSEGKNNAPKIYFAAPSGVPTSAVEAHEAGCSFDEEDIIRYSENNTEFENALTEASDRTKRWKGYRVEKVTSDLKTVYPEFLPMIQTGATEPKSFGAEIVDAVGDKLENNGRGYRLIISPFTETTDPVRTALDAGVTKPTENAIYVPYDISLYDYRQYYDGTLSPEPKQVTGYVGDIKITMSLPTEFVAAIAQDTAAGRLDNLSDRLSLYTENTGASPIQKLSFTDEGVVNNSRLISFTATHFSEFSLVYEPYVEKAFYVVDLRDDQHGDGKSRLFRGTGEGAPKRETFEVIYGTSEADAEPQNKATNPMNGYYLEIRPDDGEDIREAAWRDDGKGLQLAEKDWLLAPCDIRLFYDDGSGTENAVREVKTDFGTINIQLPIPPEMTETDRIELLTLSYEGKLERGTERNGAFRVATRTDGNASQLFAYFEATHFSEYALYYVLDSAASDTSTTASTASTEATTATGVTTSSAAGGTTATGAGTSNAAAAGSTATGANTASTATTATTSSTLASGASVAASTGGSGATNRAGATTPVAVTTGSSGSASGSDMPTTGDSDFYRMTLSMALMLFGAYELISTIRIRKKGKR